MNDKQIKAIAEGFVSDAKIQRVHGDIPEKCWIDGCDTPPTSFVILAGQVFFLCASHYDEFLRTSSRLLRAKARKEADTPNLFPASAENLRLHDIVIFRDGKRKNRFGMHNITARVLAIFKDEDTVNLALYGMVGPGSESILNGVPMKYVFLGEASDV